MRLSTLGTIALLALGVLTPQANAQACPSSAFLEFPPPGLSNSGLAKWKSLAGAREATRLLEEQLDLWLSAETVFVVRVVSHDVVDIGSPERPFQVPRTELKPVQWLKGDGEPANFTLMAMGLSSCGYVPDHPVFGAKVDQEFVVFARGPRLSEGWILKILAPLSLLDPRSLEALKTAPRVSETSEASE